MKSYRPERKIGDYADIIGLPHHVSPTRPQMSLHDRAAQFAPYEALTGYGAIVRETARLTDDELTLDEGQKEQIGIALSRVQAALEEGDAPRIRLTWFVPDARKQGGAYETLRGEVKRIDQECGRIVLRDLREIPFEAIVDLSDDSED